MKVVDLHPEELLEKEARGELRASERIRLDTHASQCATCRVERLMRADFVGELDEDMPEPSLTALLQVESILKKQDAPAARTAAPRSAERRRVPRWATWAVAAAALLAASAAGATVGGHVWTRFVGPPATAATPVDTLVAPKTTTTHAKQPHRAPAPSASVTTPVAVTEVDTLSAPTPPPPEVRAPRPPLESEAATLFDAASTARRRADYPRAIALHRELESRFPSSREAQVSRATLGRLLLDRGDPAGALASFDAYLASGAGELREETMAGRATALDRLGRASDARQAWQSLLVLFPSTPYAAHARARTEAGGDPTPSR